MMKDKEKDYIQEILIRLLKKYYKRAVQYGQIKNARRIIVKVTEVYRDYEKTNSNLQLKIQVNEAAKKLETLNYIYIDYLLYSDDIVKMYLNESMIHDIESYMEQNYEFTSRYYLVEDIKQLIKDYQHKGSITDFYCKKLNNFIENSAAEIDVNKERETLEMLAFIQSNERDLYVREVSMLVYGSSKYFEEFRYESVCNIIREATENTSKEYELNDEILRQYHISNVDQEICIKGDYVIELDNYNLETKHFIGGISLSSKDIQRIKRIMVNTENILV